MPINMNKKAINRLKAVLAEQGKTNKWLAEELGKNETTISRWYGQSCKYCYTLKS
jgi:putative transcriptional regulator